MAGAGTTRGQRESATEELESNAVALLLFRAEETKARLSRMVGNSGTAAVPSG